MRIDCHAHVFSGKTVVTVYALKVALSRLLRELPPEVAEPMEATLRAVAERKTEPGGEDLARIFVRQLNRKSPGRALLRRLPGRGRRGSDRATLRALDTLLLAGRSDGPPIRRGLGDRLERIRILTRYDIRKVADDLFRDIGPDRGVVGLMMDITRDGGGERQFTAQMEQTSRVILRHPGRFFPFVAVNPHRRKGTNWRFLMLMRRAVEEMGFVGVKLYPSLGYPLDSPEMRVVFDECLHHDLPVVTHCTSGGFTPKNKRYWTYADPRRWAALLDNPKRYRRLRYCFAHFGGDAWCVEKRDVNDAGWTEAIVGMMRQPESRIHADVSYHTAAMESRRGSAVERRYFERLGEWMEDETVRTRLLFGTDHWMVRGVCRPRAYWDYFEGRLVHYLGRRAGAAAWNRLTVENPARFLGLPTVPGVEPSAPIRRYAEFIRDRAADVTGRPEAWLKGMDGFQTDGARSTLQ